MRDITTLTSVLAGQLCIKMYWEVIFGAIPKAESVEVRNAVLWWACVLAVLDVMVDHIFSQHLE